jgi:hypothetical protein
MPERNVLEYPIIKTLWNIIQDEVTIECALIFIVFNIAL